MPEEWSKPCQTSKMMRHIENLVIVKTAHWGIIKPIQQYSAMFRHIHGHYGILRHSQALLKRIEPYSRIFRTMCNPCICSRTIFRTLAHVELEASLKVGRTCKMIRYIQRPGIVRTVYSNIFKDIQGY